MSEVIQYSAYSPDLGPQVDVEMFAGAGGLTLGLHRAGFGSPILFEANEYCCKTLADNSTGDSATINGLVIQANVKAVNWAPFAGKVRLLAGGAPCQPFSLGGKHKAHDDGRNLFPEVVRSVRELRPAAVLLENVRGIVRDSFRDYFSYIIRQLRFPDFKPKRNEVWYKHDARLKQHELKNDPDYHVKFRMLNAADYGVPQNRHRVFIVATKTDLPAYEFPHETHSQKALKIALYGDEYWDRHKISKPAHYKTQCSVVAEDALLPWVTVRDAISTLPTPSKSATEEDMNHWIVPGARSYPGHTGSNLDGVSKTIKAGVHGVPGGENTVVDHAGKFRYYTLRETARIQTFPDTHFFPGPRSRVTQQIGNAVPCELASAIAKPLYDILKNGSQ